METLPSKSLITKELVADARFTDIIFKSATFGSTSSLIDLLEVLKQLEERDGIVSTVL